MYSSLNKTKIVHNIIADIPKTNTYLNDILVIGQDISDRYWYKCFWKLTKLSCSLESSFHTIRSFSTHFVFLFKAFQKKFMSSYPFGYCLAHIQALSPLPNFLPNLASPSHVSFRLCCNHTSHRLLSKSFLFYNSGKNHSRLKDSLWIIPKST